MFNLFLRNIMLFFKDKTTVVLSFLAEFIIVALYFLFIRKNLIESFTFIENIELILDAWMIGGVLGITSVTTTMGAYGIMVDDRAKKIRRDFLTSPINKSSLMCGYMAAAIFIGLVMSFLMLTIAEFYIHYKYGVKLGANKILYIYLEIVLVTVTNSAFVLLLVSFLKSSNALAACCTILGSLIGFVTGIYLPLGSLPSSVRIVVKCFPVSHGVSLIRQSVTDSLIDDSEFIEYMGIKFVSPYISLIVLAASSILCAICAILNLNFSLNVSQSSR